jgi:single-strand DNA-binding protein
MSTVTNFVQLTGNIGKEINLMSFDSGMKKASLSIATTESYKNNKGEEVTNTMWHNLVAWGKTAEQMAEKLTKGNKITIQGKLSNRSYESKEGAKKYITEVTVNKFEKIEVAIQQLNVPNI